MSVGPTTGDLLRTCLTKVPKTTPLRVIIRELESKRIIHDCPVNIVGTGMTADTVVGEEVFEIQVLWSRSFLKKKEGPRG